MRVLGIESSGAACGVALADHTGVVGAVEFPDPRQLSRTLAGGVEALLDAQGLDVTDLEGLAVCIGPGAFTGIRLGVAFAKALAYGRGVPLVGVGALAALAYQHPGTEEGPRCIVLPASLDCIYAALPGLPGREGAWSLPDLVQELAGSPPFTLIGPDSEIVEALRSRLGELAVSYVPTRPPLAPTVVLLGRAALLRGEARTVHELAPRYLRASTPEIRRQRAEGAP